ncbi:queuosine precursor transporter [Candidatus Berkiella aquae]|uniref:Probable queuosine precursor transporter n=1 Tax=Candidatus Berkiella aquae TaxID=295108 RepID=A0A0Q9YV93_9GAMM|nr:queuosine precursor transporter [Candidatus Berkiella aquae]MCS5710175.1 queuosine precursor transporter [Candidatus Berkiella aquae]
MLTKKYAQRHEQVFLLLAGIFLGTLGIINILGLTRFIDLSFTFANQEIPMIIPIGVLPYPITFLCTDIISEFYGKARANRVVWIGLIVNLWILLIIWFAGFLPPSVALDPVTHLPATTHPDYAFFRIRNFTTGCVIGSMLAYLIAQLLDVHLFHYWKKVTHGKHLWLRNNASTLVSQLVDTTIVIFSTHWFSNGLPLSPEKGVLTQIFTLILCCYCFKAICALLDTIPFYLVVLGLRRYFGITEYAQETNSLIAITSS